MLRVEELGVLRTVLPHRQVLRHGAQLGAAAAVAAQVHDAHLERRQHLGRHAARRAHEREAAVLQRRLRRNRTFSE